jgi:hypothetical protein
MKSKEKCHKKKKNSNDVLIREDLPFHSPATTVEHLHVIKYELLSADVSFEFSFPRLIASLWCLSRNVKEGSLES